MAGDSLAPQNPIFAGHRHERENATLKWLLADAELEKAALKEIARGNF